ncbi:catalase/peroxidase HPI [Wenzhouxiangella marina]
MTASTATMAMGDARSNQFWWPDQLDLSPLRDQDASSNPYGEDFDYAAEFATLDLDEVKADIRAVLTDSQDWWPADWGHYGPFFIRMAWHSAGTYRVVDGRGGAGGGQLRFDPQNSWPDNANLDKARRLLWPIKQKYGRALSWADLMVLTGNVSMEDMGFQTFGFAGGREDDWEPDLVYWGPEEAMLAAERRDGNGRLEGPVAATQMGLIYVNSAGPGGVPDPIAAAQAIRESFGRMAMNDEETLALIAGGHTFGKVHGARDPGECVGAEPAAAPIEDMGMGWKNRCGTGNGADTITSGHEGAWTQQPTRWTMLYLTNLLGFEWELSESPSGAPQWVAKNGALDGTVPEVQPGAGTSTPIMLTTDVALKRDPAYRAIAERFLANPQEFEDAFARAWFKLTHRDMGPRARYVGSEVPADVLSWQDPVPTWDGDVISDAQIADLKETILDSGLTVPELVRTAWASASTYRASDMRGGANGARIRLEPQIGWEVNNPEELTRVLGVLEGIQQDFNGRRGADISMADLIVLGGAAAIEKAAADAGHDITVPFVPGRGDATQAMTEVDSFGWLEPYADAFRNYYSDRHYFPPLDAMVDKAALLDLTVPEMAALIGGMRALDANIGGADHGVFTDTPGQLTNDFFVNVLSMDYQWRQHEDMEGIYVGSSRATGEDLWTATPVDLIFGSNSELRAVSEAYASVDGEEEFVNDFVAAWVKVMQADRFDI